VRSPSPTAATPRPTLPVLPDELTALRQQPGIGQQLQELQQLKTVGMDSTRAKVLEQRANKDAAKARQDAARRAQAVSCWLQCLICAIADVAMRGWMAGKECRPCSSWCGFILVPHSCPSMYTHLPTPAPLPNRSRSTYDPCWPPSRCHPAMRKKRP